MTKFNAQIFLTFHEIIFFVYEKLFFCDFTSQQNLIVFYSAEAYSSHGINKSTTEASKHDTEKSTAALVDISRVPTLKHNGKFVTLLKKGLMKK